MPYLPQKVLQVETQIAVILAQMEFDGMGRPCTISQAFGTACCRHTLQQVALLIDKRDCSQCCCCFKTLTAIAKIMSFVKIV